LSSVFLLIWQFRAINRVAANRKTAMKDHSSVKNFEPTSIDYDARIFAFREKHEEVSVTLLRSRQRIKLMLGDDQRAKYPLVIG
jgi:putative transposase